MEPVFVFPGQQQRVCLACNHTFNSDGPGNRICHSCKREQPSLARREIGRVMGSAKRRLLKSSILWLED